MGGFFFHAREGLVTSFLGEEWMKAFEASVDEAEKFGMKAWIYDELRWPSGFAGGIVPALSKKYRAKALVMVVEGRAFEGEDLITAFRCKLDEKGMPTLVEKAEPGEVVNGYLYLNFMLYVAPIGETWFSGTSYVDTLSHEAVKAFIKAAYEPYAERFRDKFETVIPGVFTDEPNIVASRPPMKSTLDPPRGPCISAFWVPWTDDLPKRFKEMHGYDILEHLPSLFLDVGEYTKVRYDFWKTVTKMFLEAYSKQLYDWCDKYGLKYTGHYLAEDTLLSQLKCAGAVMPHYEYMHIPGVDHLGLHIDHVLTMKQVASVANQLGRNRVLSETYGGSGQNLSFEDRKWIGDWEYVLGINLLNHHLSLYTMRGRRKRDYPPNIFYQQPYWKYDSLIEDHFARLSYVLSLGVRIAPILVVHPIGSAWALYTPLNERRIRELDEKLDWLVKTLLKLHYDYELGDEMVMEKHASVEGAKLRVGRCYYEVVIIPPSVTISENTLRLLEEFVKNGGKLIAVKPSPTMVNGVRDQRIEKLFSSAVIVESGDTEGLKKALEDAPKPVIIEGDTGEVLYHLRRVDDSLVLFLANTSREKTFKLRVGVKGVGKAVLLDTFTGDTRPVPNKIEGGRTWIKLTLHPVGSALIMLDLKASPEEYEEEEVKVLREEAIEGEWGVQRGDPNVLLLDYCKYKIEDGEWSDPVPVRKAHVEISAAGVGTRFTHRFEFESKIDLKGRNVYLVVETPEKYKFTINGQVVPWKDEGWWIDKTFRKMKVGHLLRKGVNVVEMEGVVGIETEIEDAYLIGDFAVEACKGGRSIIVGEKSSVDPADLCAQGYPFYAGTLTLTKTINIKPDGSRVFLCLEELNSTVAEILVNGKLAGVLFMKPYEVDITDYIKEGENEVKIVLINSLRNLLGPHHNEAVIPALGRRILVSRNSFRNFDTWVDEYLLEPYGVKKPKIKYVKG